MQKAPSKSMAALWMSGWLSLTLVMVVAGREATRELNVFELMELRSVLGLVLLYPLIHLNGGLAIQAVQKPRFRTAVRRLRFESRAGWDTSAVNRVIRRRFILSIWTR
jgi:hypothetical protein